MCLIVNNGKNGSGRPIKFTDWEKQTGIVKEEIREGHFYELQTDLANLLQLIKDFRLHPLVKKVLFYIPNHIFNHKFVNLHLP